MKKKTSIYKLLIYIICLCSFSSCFQPEEGCLDIEATNFVLAADRNCSKDATASCFCKYPKVSLQIEQVFDKSVFSTNQIYRTTAGDYIQIPNIQFYISDIQLILEDGQIATTLDTITLTLTDNDQLQNKLSFDDFFLIQPQTQQINSLITTNLSGTFSRLQFSVGIKSPENTTTPNQVKRISHPLAIDSLYVENLGYIYNELTIQPDTSLTEVIVVQLTHMDGLQKVILDISPITKQPGKEISIQTLQINHAKWFDGINFVTNSQEEIRRKIVTNTTKVFSILP